MTNNDMKWGSIPLTVTLMLDDYNIPSNRLRQALFETPCSATQKYDGTNVGQDEHGVLYGRNHTIPADAQTYQKTPLAPLRKVEAASILAIKTQVAKVAGVDPSHMDRFVVYGELMCNSKYNYDELKLTKRAWPVFGAMVRVAEGVDGAGLVQTLCNAGIIAILCDTGLIMLSINKTLGGIFEQHGLMCVPSCGHYACLYDLVVANKQWMIQGNGEGLVIASDPLPATAATGVGDGDRDEEDEDTAVKGCFVHKWKIGVESVTSNNAAKLKAALDAVPSTTTWGYKAKDLFQMMLDVNSSQLVCGEVPQPKSKKDKQKGAKANKEVEMSAEVAQVYEVAMESAASKFDHREAFFAKDKMKGAMSYAGLMAAECREDVGVDVDDSAAMEQHKQIVTQMVKKLFIEYMRSQGKKKNQGPTGA